MKKFFLNPDTMDISEMTQNIELLHKNFSKYFATSNARMRNDIEKKYAEILEKECLNDDEKTVKEVFEELAYYAQGIVKWNHPGTMININPPASLPSVAAASYVSLYNPNGAQDMSCGYLLTTELAVVKMMCSLVGIDEKKAGGIFTFGGKSTNLHALKHGIQRIDPKATEHGIKDNIVTFSSKQGHPCHAEVCGWLGIGKAKCIRISTDYMGRIDMQELEEKLNDVLSKGIKVASITANGGTTIQMTIDPIKEIVDLRDRLVEKYNLPYKPRIHVDSVIGWVFLFFRNYDYEKNELNLRKSTLQKIKRQCERIDELRYADSFGVDFHKTGFCSYLSSLYITQDKMELYNQENVVPIDYDELEYGNYSPFQYTLELSRPLNGPIEAYVNLKLFGKKGFQKLIGNLFDATEFLKEELMINPRIEVINDKDSDGFVTLFIVKETPESPSFFELGNLSLEECRQVGLYNHKFYLYLLEQQKLGNCWFALDYSSGYHVLSNGVKIGVQKAYPMTPYFDEKVARKLVGDLSVFLNEFDLIKDNFEIKEVPHKPRPFVFR